MLLSELRYRYSEDIGDKEVTQPGEQYCCTRGVCLQSAMQVPERGAGVSPQPMPEDCTAQYTRTSKAGTEDGCQNLIGVVAVAIASWDESAMLTTLTGKALRRTPASYGLCNAFFVARLPGRC